jgi:hypothetical protein
MGGACESPCNFPTDPMLKAPNARSMKLYLFSEYRERTRHQNEQTNPFDLRRGNELAEISEKNKPIFLFPVLSGLGRAEQGCDLTDKKVRTTGVRTYSMYCWSPAFAGVTCDVETPAGISTYILFLDYKKEGGSASGPTLYSCRNPCRDFDLLFMSGSHGSRPTGFPRARE